jgi:hypothetical protein
MPAPSGKGPKWTEFRVTGESWPNSTLIWPLDSASLSFSAVVVVGVVFVMVLSLGFVGEIVIK